LKFKKKKILLFDKMKKTFPCPNCPKSLSSRHYLIKHLQKKTPCDNKCRECNYQGKDITDYKLHKSSGCNIGGVGMNETSESKIVNKELQMVPIVETSQYPIPIQDYNLAMYKTLKDLKLDGNLEDYDIEYYVMQTEKGKEEIDMIVGHKLNGDKRVDKITKINIEVERHETIILRKRVKDARNAITNNMLYGALCSMVPTDIEMENLNRIATDMMYQVLHHDDPRLHNMCLSDMSRGTVRVFSRVSESEKCYWAAHPKDTAPKIINEHAKNLFSFLLEAGTQSLVSAFWKTGKVNCLALNGEKGWSVILYEEDTSPGDDSKLIVNKVKTTDLIYTLAEVEGVDRLAQLVKTRKEEVIQLLQKLIIDNTEIQKCLRECRRFCFVTMQKNHC
jgi:hypothetical protein